jgi:hypothetical protein
LITKPLFLIVQLSKSEIIDNSEEKKIINKLEGMGSPTPPSWLMDCMGGQKWQNWAKVAKLGKSGKSGQKWARQSPASITRVNHPMNLAKE